jgi:hypothetical protein
VFAPTVSRSCSLPKDDPGKAPAIRAEWSRKC